MSENTRETLQAIINGDASPKAELFGGLRLQFRQQDGECRLLVYRRGDPPSTLEYAMMRRELESIVGEVGLGQEIKYLASDGQFRNGRSFVWAADTPV